MIPYTRQERSSNVNESNRGPAYTSLIEGTMLAIGIHMHQLYGSGLTPTKGVLMQDVEVEFDMSGDSLTL